MKLQFTVRRLLVQFADTNNVVIKKEKKMSNKEIEKVIEMHLARYPYDEKNFIKDVDARLDKWQSCADADLIKTREECMYGFVVEIYNIMQNAQKKGFRQLKELFVYASNRGLCSWNKYKEAEKIYLEIHKCYLMVLSKSDTEESQEEIERITDILNNYNNLKKEVA